MSKRFGMDRRTAGLLSAACLAALGSSAQAGVVNTWQGASPGSWGTAGNWAGGVPTSDSDVAFGASANATTALDADRSVNTLNFAAGANHTVTIDANSSGTTARTLTVAGSTDSAYTGAASGDLIYVASGAANIGATANTGRLNLAFSDDGNINVASGASLTLGSNIYLTASDRTLAFTGGGTLTLAAGNGNPTALKGFSFSSGTLILNGTRPFGSLSSTKVTIGGGTIGSTAAAQVNLTSLTSWELAGDFTYDGTQTLALNGAFALSAGETRTITVTESGGKALMLNSVVSGDGSGLTKAGAGTLQLAGDAGTGNTYSGTTTVSGGTLTLAKTLVGPQDGGNGAIAGNLVVDGGTVRIMGHNQIADTSSVTISSGKIYANSGGLADTIASLDVNGGTLESGAWTVTGVTRVRAGGTVGAKLTTNGITLGNGASVTGALTLQGNAGYDGNGAGATISTGGVSLNGNRTFNVTRGNSTADMALNTGVSDGSSASGITKTGAGILRLGAATNTYTGGTTINGGILLAVSNDSLGAGSVNVNSGGTLALGEQSDRVFTRAVTFASGGAIAGLGVYSPTGGFVVGSGVIVAPGIANGTNDVGTLTFGGNGLTLSDGAVYNYDIASGGADLAKVTGTNSKLTLGGNYTLNVSKLGDIDPTGQTFTLFTYSTGAAPTVGTWTINLPTGWQGGSVTVDSANKQVVLSGITVPEPSTPLVLLGLWSVGVLRRRRPRR